MALSKKSPEDRYDAATRLANESTPDGSSCPKRPDSQCSVQDWIYEMESADPRMYGRCSACGTRFAIVLPRRADYAYLVRASDVEAYRDAIVIEAAEFIFRSPAVAPRLLGVLRERQVSIRRDVLVEIERRAIDQVRSFNRQREEQLTELLRLVDERSKELWHEISRYSHRALMGSAAKAQRAIEALREESRRERATLKSLRDQMAAVLERVREARESAIRPAVVPSTTGAVPGVVLCSDVAPDELIYALVDPAEPNVVRYIGRTYDAVMRYRSHCRTGSDAVATWVESLAKLDRRPIMLLVERCPGTESGAREAFWIHHYRDQLQADLNRQIPGRPEAS